LIMSVYDGAGADRDDFRGRAGRIGVRRAR
jgi:hypothetical protein